MVAIGGEGGGVGGGDGKEGGEERRRSELPCSSPSPGYSLRVWGRSGVVAWERELATRRHCRSALSSPSVPASEGERGEQVVSYGASGQVDDDREEGKAMVFGRSLEKDIRMCREESERVWESRERKEQIGGRWKMEWNSTALSASLEAHLLLAITCSSTDIAACASSCY